MTLPNLITIGRIFLVPVIVWLLFNHDFVWAFVMFLVAGISDAVDGFIAKQFNLRSELGAYLDPIADKALLVAIYVVLGIFEHLPAWLVIMVVSRDVAIVGAVMLSWLIDRPVEMEPHIVSKANTVMQIVLVVLVLGGLAFARLPEELVSVPTAVVGLLTAASLAVYLRDWLQHMTDPAGQGPARKGRDWPAVQEAAKMTIQRQVSVWLIALAAIIAFMWLFTDILLPFLAGIVLAYFLDPVADALERLKMPRLAPP